MLNVKKKPNFLYFFTFDKLFLPLFIKKKIKRGYGEKKEKKKKGGGGFFFIFF